MSGVLDRKRVKLNTSGGSKSIIVPKNWLRRVGAQDAAEMELVLTEDAIALQVLHHDSIESEPEFATFLDFLTRSALAHPESLTEASDFFESDGELLGRSR